MSKAELAAENMKKGYNCAQSIVKAFAGEVGIENEEDLIKIAASLGGGMGRNGHVCGAVSGAALILGKKYGNSQPADVQAREKAYNTTNLLLEAFEKEHQSVMCKDLISINMKNPEELKKAREAGVFQNQCPLFVRSSGRLLEKLLESE